MFSQFRKSLGDFGGGLDTAFNWDNPTFFTYLVIEE